MNRTQAEKLLYSYTLAVEHLHDEPDSDDAAEIAESLKDAVLDAMTSTSPAPYPVPIYPKYPCYPSCPTPRFPLYPTVTWTQSTGWETLPSFDMRKSSDNSNNVYYTKEVNA